MKKVFINTGIAKFDKVDDWCAVFEFLKTNLPACHFQIGFDHKAALYGHTHFYYIRFGHYATLPLKPKME